MSDSNAAEWQTDDAPADDGKAVKSRSRAVKAGHLEVGEFTSGIIGASAPFGNAVFPLPVGDLYYEPSKPVPARLLDDERH